MLGRKDELEVTVMIHIWAYQNGKGPTRIKVTERAQLG